MGVSVHPPHQRLTPASRDPHQATPSSETQSRILPPRICELVRKWLTFDPVIKISEQENALSLHRQNLRRKNVFCWTGDVNVNVELACFFCFFFILTLKLWGFFSKGSENGTQVRKLNQHRSVFRAFSSICVIVLCEFSIFILFPLLVALF